MDVTGVDGSGGEWSLEGRPSGNLVYWSTLLADLMVDLLVDT